MTLSTKRSGRCSSCEYYEQHFGSEPHVCNYGISGDSTWIDIQHYIVDEHKLPPSSSDVNYDTYQLFLRGQCKYFSERTTESDTSSSESSGSKSTARSGANVGAIAGGLAVRGAGGLAKIILKALYWIYIGWWWWLLTKKFIPFYKRMLVKNKKTTLKITAIVVGFWIIFALSLQFFIH